MVVSGDLVRPGGGVVQTTYLVFIRVEPANPGDPNVEVVGIKLTAGAAETVKQQYPGAWVEKAYADKKAAPPAAAGGAVAKSQG